MNPLSFGSSLGIGPEAMAERYKIFKLLLTGFIFIAAFTVIRSCSFELPTWLGGTTKEQIIEINKNLKEEIKEIATINKDNIEDRKRHDDAVIASDLVYNDYKDTKKEIEKVTENRKTDYRQKIKEVEKSVKHSDKTNTPVSIEAKQIISISVDAVWDAFEEK